MRSHRRLFGALQIIVPILAYHALIIFAVYKLIDSTNDEYIPQTDSIYAYTYNYLYEYSDNKWDRIRSEYLAASHIVPEDETRGITFDDIPDISTWDGVKKIYVRNDVAIAEKSRLEREGEVFNIAVPADTIAHYNYYTRMLQEFGYQPGYSDIPVLDVYKYEYIVFNYDELRYENVYAEPDLYLYYEYDPSTWDQFRTDLDAYYEDKTDEPYPHILISVDGDSAAIQQKLVREYPASCYVSKEFTSTWKTYRRNKLIITLVTALVLTVAAVIALEILFSKLKKRI